jgi:hypothetical protein
MMAPASYAHQRIVGNLCELLNSAFAARKLDLFAYFDVGVRSPGVRNFQPQPDVVVVPGVAGYDLYSERFQLVAEVIEPREFSVEIYAKRDSWQPAILRKPDDQIEMLEFGLRCRLGDLAAAVSGP